MCDERRRRGKVKESEERAGEEGGKGRMSEGLEGGGSAKEYDGVMWRGRGRKEDAR